MAHPPPGGWQAAPNRLAQDGNQKKSKFRRKKDLGQPKRPTTAYDVFFRNTYPNLKESRPDLTQQKLFAEVGRLWRETTTWQDRQVCFDFADWEKEEYDKAKVGWKTQRKAQKEEEERLKAERQQEIIDEEAVEVAQPAGRVEQCRQQ